MDESRVKARIAGREQANQLLDLLTWDDGYGADFADALLGELRSKLPQRRQPSLGPRRQEHFTFRQLESHVIPFGKHAGETLGNAPRDYLDWLCMSQEDFLRLLKAYLTHPDRPTE